VSTVISGNEREVSKDKVKNSSKTSAVGSDEVPDALTAVIDSVATVISTDNSSLSLDAPTTTAVVSEQPTATCGEFSRRF
jgi:hypothetical protein